MFPQIEYKEKDEPVIPFDGLALLSSVDLS